MGRREPGDSGPYSSTTRVLRSTSLTLPVYVLSFFTFPLDFPRRAQLRQKELFHRRDPLVRIGLVGVVPHHHLEGRHGRVRFGGPPQSAGRQYRQVDGRPEYAEVKTPKSERSFTIDPATARVLMALKDAQREAFGRDWSSAWPLFMRPDLTPFRPDYVSRKFQQEARAVGLLPIGPHGLRHSLATALGGAGMPLLAVSRLLGHSSTRVTSDVYTHVFAEKAGEAVGMVAGMLRGD